MGLCVQVFVYLLFILRFNDLDVLEPGLLLVDDLLDFQGEWLTGPEIGLQFAEPSVVKGIHLFNAAFESAFDKIGSTRGLDTNLPYLPQS